MHSRRTSARRSSARAHRAGLALVLAVALGPASVHAESRTMIDLEPVTAYFSTGSLARDTIFVLGVHFGWRYGSWFPYAGGALGFFTVQARGGVEWLPGDLEEPSFMMRLEARTQLLLNPCVEPLFIGNLGAGYRWPIERGDPGVPGTAMYIMPAFTGGIGLVHENCAKANERPIAPVGLFGGTLVGGFDW